MTKSEYFKYGMKNHLYSKMKWILTMFAIPVDEYTENEYIKIIDKKYHLKVNGELIPTDIEISKPYLNMKMSVDMSDSEDLSDLGITTVGISLVNMILIREPFKDKLKLINGNVKIGAIEKQIVKLMKNGVITINEYEKFSISVSYLVNFSKLVTISATEKTLLPPTDINKYKKQVRLELVEKYGNEWEKNITAIAEYENRLKAYDDEYLKDDPTYNKFTSGKVKNIARKKMYLTFGAEFGFDKTASNPEMIDPSLMDGYPKDKDKLATIINTARAGYFDRGSETQKGGVVAKETLRSTASSRIVKNFCNTTRQSIVDVNKNNTSLIANRYINDNNKQVLVDDVEQYIGKSVKLYTPLYCEAKDGNFCYVCSGEAIREYENGISLLVSSIAGIILNTSMKSMHGTVLSTVDVDINSLLV